MRFGIAMEVDANAERNARVVQEFAEALSNALDHDYGADLQSLTVGIVCIQWRPGYEGWYKPRAPRFRDRQRVKLLDGASEVLRKTFPYDVRLTAEEYEIFVSASPRDATELISNRLRDSLSNLDALPPKVKDFDRARFKADFERYSEVALSAV